MSLQCPWLYEVPGGSEGFYTHIDIFKIFPIDKRGLFKSLRAFEWLCEAHGSLEGLHLHIHTDTCTRAFTNSPGDLTNFVHTLSH